MSFWKRKRVFVTGATGLVGSWLSKRLVREGADVVALVRDRVPKSFVGQELERDIVSVYGDVREMDVVSRAIGEYQIEVIFHLAAQTIVPVANLSPALTFNVNVGGTVTVLEAARRFPHVDAIVLASSDKAYGDHGSKAYTEDMELRGQHPYDASKAAMEVVSRSYAKSYGMPIGVTRCGNFFGGGDLNWNRLVPGAIRAAYDGEPLQIRSNGQLVRDYFYVEDGVDAYMRLAEAIAHQKDRGGSELFGEAYNFSYERPLTVLALAELIAKTMGSKQPPVLLNEASLEIPCQVLSSERARSELGWRPAHTLEQGLDKTIAWYTEVLDRVGLPDQRMTTHVRGDA